MEQGKSIRKGAFIMPGCGVATRSEHTLYGGTKSEMDRLIKDAMKLDKTFKVATKTTGKGKKANKELAYSYADIVQAIHIVQNEMGITGTTAKEAEKTISGSLNMMKAAWRNLLTGLGEGSDKKVDMLVEQLIYSAEKVLDNMLPVIEKVLYGIVTMIEGLAPIIADKLPAFVERILPPLTKATATLVKAFTKVLIQNMPVIIKCAKDILKEVFKAIQEEAPGLLPIILGVGGVKAVGTGVKAASGIKNLLVSLGLIKGAGTAAQAAANAAGTAVAGAGEAAAAAAPAVAGAGEAAAAAGTSMTAASTGASGLAAVLSKLGVIGLAVGDALLVAYDANKIVDAFNGYKQAGDTYTKERENAIATYRKLVEEQGLEAANSWAQAVYGIESKAHNALQTERMILHKIEESWSGAPKNWWDGLKQGWDYYFGSNGKGFGALIDDGIFGPVKRAIEGAWNWGKDLVSNFIGGINNMWERAKGVVSDFAGMIRQYIGFSEPEEGPLSDFHTYAPDMMALFAQGIQDNADLITDAISGAFNLAPQITAQTQPQTPAPAQQIVTPRAQPQRPIQIIFEIDGAQRWIYNAVQAESQRVGVKLSGVTA